MGRDRVIMVQVAIILKQTIINSGTVQGEMVLLEPIKMVQGRTDQGVLDKAKMVRAI